MIKLRAILASGCFFLSYPAIGQVQVSEIPVIDATGEMCTDVAPFNDNFGWNGTCSCELDQNYRRFGWSIATSDNLLVAGSLQTPEGCFESGAASVYEIENGELPRKVADLQSSARAAGDGFSTRQSQIAISDNYVAISTARSVNGIERAVTVFDRNTWEETYVLRSSTVNDFGTRFSFGNQLEIIGDSVFVGESGPFFRYRLSDGVLQQTIPSDPDYTCLGSISASAASLVVYRSACTVGGGGSQISIYEPDASGQYRNVFSATDQRHGIPQTSDNIVVSAAYGRSFHRGTDGQWNVLQLPLDISRHGVYLADEQLIYLEDDTILIHELNSSGWELVQTLTYSFETEPSFGQLVRAEFDGNTFALIRSNASNTSQNYELGDARGKVVAPEILIFQRNSQGQWNSTDQRIFPVSSSVTDGPITDAVAIVGNNAFFSMHEGQSILHYQLSSTDTPGTEINNSESDSNEIDAINGCDYSTAEQFDGYGWNPVTRESCPPLDATETETPVTVTPETPAGCDYRNAINGWGWNETTRQSCPPLTVAAEQQTPESSVGCDYSNAINGWGWNETARQSCPPLTVAVAQPTPEAPAGCDYSNSVNGWGWNETTRQSCEPL